MPVTRDTKGDQKAMLKIRPFVRALLGALAIGAVVASSASANWFIEGAELPAGSKAALATTAKVAETSTLLVPALGLSVLCGGSALDGTSPEVIGGSTLQASSLTFLACKTTSPASGCALKESNQSISTAPISASVIEATSPDAKLRIAAKTKNILSEIAFSEANTCAFNGLEPVKGSLTLNAPALQEERTEQPIEGLGSTENNSLEIGGSKAYIDGGKAQLNLAAGGRWVFLGNNPVYSFAERVAGSVMSTISFCYFDKTNDWCEIQVEVVKTGAAAALKFAKEDIEPPTEPFIKKGAPAMGAECKPGNKIGGATSKCYIRLEYTGANNPGKGKFKATYKIQTQEEGGNNKVFNDYIFLEAEKS